MVSPHQTDTGGAMLRGAGVRRTVLWAVAVTALLLGSGAPAAAADDGVPSQAAYLAEQLRKDPVYVSDQIPRSVPRSTAPKYAEIARRTGVPTYVMVLPDYAAPHGLLAPVHDRLGRDGLYVLLDGSAIVEAEGFGIRLPVDDAARATQYELPYDAGTAYTFAHFVSVLTSDDAKQRADEAAERFGSGDDEPDEMWLSSTDRRNQGFVTGIALSGIPLTILLVGWSLYRRRRRSVAESAPPVSLRKDGKPATGPGRRRSAVLFPVALVLAAGVSATAVLLGALSVFDQTRSAPDLPPTAQDMRARADRVADRLGADPLYLDPESPRVLAGPERARLERELAGMDLPVYVAVVPSLTEDAAGGDSDLFAHKLHRRLGRNALYVTADPLTGIIDVSNQGSRIDPGSVYKTLRDVAFEDPASQADDHHLYERLDALLSGFDDAPTGRPGPLPEPQPAPDPVAEDTLPPLLTSDFWPGLTVCGPFAALVVWGAVAGALAFARFRRRRRDERDDGAPAPRHRFQEAPQRPSIGWLRRTARAEIDALGEEFDRRSGELDDDLRTRVWECLDAAVLCADRDEDDHIDADADAGRLACVVTLLRLGAGMLRTGSEGAGAHFCVLNPLHGPASRWRKLRLASEPGAGARRLPVCDRCRDGGPGAADAAMLRLPAAGHGPTRRYDALDGPLAAAEGDTERLVNDVRGNLGVH